MSKQIFLIYSKNHLFSNLKLLVTRRRIFSMINRHDIFKLKNSKTG